MNDPSQVPFPYNPPNVKIKQASRKISLKEGIKRPIEKYGWISEGPLKPIEKGLPLIFGSLVSHSFEDIEVSHKRFVDFVNQYKKFKSKGSDDSNDETDEIEEVEENINDSINPFKFLTDRVAELQKKEVETETKKTGITHSPEKKGELPRNIIDSIAPIKFASVKPTHEIKKPLNLNPFYHPQYDTKKKVQSKSTVPVLNQQLKRVFIPGNAPFENVDKPEDFPATMLLPTVTENSNKRAQSDLSLLKRKNNRIVNPKNAIKNNKLPDNNKKLNSRKKDDEHFLSASSSSSLLITEMKPDMYSKETFSEENNENETEADKSEADKKIQFNDLKDVPSTLIDPTRDDVFFTKNKTPFTRNDINHIYSWQVQNDDIIASIDEKRNKRMEEREKAIITTFESKEAFLHAVELVDKDCKRIVHIGPGKSEKKKKSFWIEAAKYAQNDKSSLMYRKKKWDEFMKEVQNSFHLLVKQEKKSNKEDNFSSSPYFSTIADSNHNLTSDSILSSSKPEINFSKTLQQNLIGNSIVASDNSECIEENIQMNEISVRGEIDSEKEELYKKGLMKNQVDFILRYKAEALSGKAIDPSTFWKVVQPFQAVDFTHTEFCILIEILRSQLGVTKSEVKTYLEEKDFPTLFYHLASTSPDYQPISEKKTEKKKGKKMQVLNNGPSYIYDAVKQASIDSPPR